MNASTAVRHRECSICMGSGLGQRAYSELGNITIDADQGHAIHICEKNRSETRLVCLDLRNHSDEDVSVVSSPVLPSGK